MDNVGGVSCHAAAALRCLFSLECVCCALERAPASEGGRGMPETLARLHGLLKAHDETGESAPRAGATKEFRRVLRRLVGGESGDRPAPRRPRQQEDAHETMCTLLEMSGLDKLFEGAEISGIRCIACGVTKHVSAVFSFLTAVDPGERSGDVCSGLSESFREETIEGYECGRCGSTEGSCAKSRAISDLPKVLAVRCVWPGEPESTGAAMSIDISACCSPPRRGWGIVRGLVGGSRGRYLLRSALLHVGSAESGHYTSMTLWSGGSLRPVLHDDGESKEAPDGTVVTDSSGRPEAIRVPGARLHTAIYEKKI